MDMYSALRSKPHNARQLERYIKFIESRKLQKGPLEKHHICPVANDLFPQFSSFKDHPWNRIDLTPREHYVAHLLLWKAYGGSQANAIRFMTPATKRNSRVYLSARLSVLQSLLGNPRSEETRKKISQSRKGIIFSEETKHKISSNRLGKGTGPKSADTKAKMSKSQSGKTLSMEQRQKISSSLSGKVLSEETKEKIRQSLKKRIEA